MRNVQATRGTAGALYVCVCACLRWPASLAPSTRGLETTRTGHKRTEPSGDKSRETVCGDANGRGGGLLQLAPSLSVSPSSQGAASFSERPLSELAHPLGVLPWAACGPRPEMTLVVDVFAFQWGFSLDGSKDLGELLE